MFYQCFLRHSCYNFSLPQQGEGEVDFDGIFETLREMDFANRQLSPDAPKVGGDNIACVSYFGFPEKMDKQALGARERIKRALLGA